MTVSVTQEHINKGIKGSCSQCPVALAIRDAIEEKDDSGLSAIVTGVFSAPWRGWVAVNNAIMTVCIGTTNRGWITPESVASFVTKFDAGAKVEPFEFEVPA